MRHLISSFLLFVISSLPGFAQQEASYSVQVENLVIPYAEFGIFVLPEEQKTIEVLLDEDDSFYALSNAGVLAETDKSYQWTWKAPEKTGVYAVTIFNSANDDSVKLNFFVMVPYSTVRQGKLNAYRIGNYPSSSKPAYAKPEGFIEVTPENRDTPVSPHFTIGEFLCKQESTFPKYVVLQEKLVLKLELIINELRSRGVNVKDVKVMSGYRTPYYNQAIGNVQYSRHVFGDAADIYVDNDNDYRMDDLNGDGVSNKKDARLIYQMIDDMKDQGWDKNFIGGLGLYGANSRHPAFVHVDGRGYAARWGK